ncbi:MAG: LptA/OstA family protein [Merismopediaceae bacterium]|nr:LptA/OstA family protein [Merismopediaceae bacterium]
MVAYLPAFLKSGSQGQWGNFFGAIASVASVILLTPSLSQANPPASPMTVRSDIQEANSQTGVVTARGNVQVYYPARQMQATAAQAQYYSRERRLVLSGNVYVLQQGNSMRAEVMTYLIDEGRFVANPQTNQQVESIYLVQETEENNAAPRPVTPVMDDSLPSLPPLNSTP